jgi:uncharacterized peroxidase-related enzyme
MAIIDTVMPDAARGKVAQIYRQCEQKLGHVPNGIKIYSGSPFLLAQQWDLIGYYMSHPSLSFPLLALIRLLVSQENDCTYCVDLNSVMLMDMAGLTEEYLVTLRADPESAPISDKEKRMLRFVLSAVKNPKQVSRSDIETLRDAGWSDSDILDGLGHGARMAASGIIFNALKIENDF